MVVIIIAVLASVAIPKIKNGTVRGRESSLKMDLKLLRSAIDRFQNDTGMIPVAIADMTSSKPPDSGIDRTGNKAALDAARYYGPYIDAEPMDPVSKKAFSYTFDKFGKPSIKPSASGKASDGTDYANW